MRSIVVCLPGAIERRVVNEIQRHGHRLALRARRIDEVETAVECGDAEWAVIGAGPEHLTSRMLSVCDVAGVRVVALAAGDTERRHAADLGLREVLDAGASWPQIEETLSSGFTDTGDNAALHRDRAASPVGLDRGGVIAVWGPAGAPGRTTLAITIAAELAAEGYSVVLADADTHSGAVAPSLGLLDEAPGFAAACRLASTESLDTTELERISDRYSSPHGSFWVLTGIGRAHRWPELSGDRVAATLAACRAWVDFTVVDTGFSLEQDEEISSDLFAPQRNAATITALREADQVIAVGAGDPVGLSRFLRAHVDLLEIVDAERVLTVVNRVRGSVIGANPSAQVAHTLLRFGGIVAAALVPHDQASLDSAILSGKTLADVAPKSAPRLALRVFVTSHLVPQQVEPAKGRLRRSRFEPAPVRTPARQ
ncbi:MAG: regulator [Microbacteriaceae bacterium]|nr:regulator [Microbacteriaceae bacterium]